MQKAYVDFIPPEAGREYQLTQLPSGNTQITDQTQYVQRGASWGSSDILSGCEMEFTHSKSGTVHNFVNPNTQAAKGRAKLTANIEAGDTFQVNGKPVTAYMGSYPADSSMAGQPYDGKVITFTIDGENLFFTGGSGSDTAKNVAGYVGEISLFADNQLRENHVWADGSTINPATWPDLAAYAATAGWETDSSTGWYKTPNLQGCFLLPSSAEHAVNTTGGEATHTLTVDEMPAHKHELTVGYRTLYMSADEGQGRKSGDLITESGSGAKSYTTTSTGSGQPHNNMPPYYVVTAQIRAKVDIISATAVEVNGNTLGGFDDGQVLAQQGGKIVGKEITAASLGAVQPYKAGDTIKLNHSAVVAYVTAGGTDLNFQIPLDRPVNATAAAFSGQINVRMSTGQYALNNITIQSTDSAIGPSGIKFTLKPSWDNAPANNVVLVVQIYNGATITLS